ncbi:unnamed protein product [Dovyalis caffra]|uniref:Uncharacterized protein n=1 Tax=Dovyalis caffra TaxID=77055 RepID=A0AAV1QWI1_9ROSI|nr:unnamed protein product [Dovyalis caffra]
MSVIKQVSCIKPQVPTGEGHGGDSESENVILNDFWDSENETHKISHLAVVQRHR